MKLTADKTILITGATDGLGKTLAFRLARQGVRLLIHGRDSAKGSTVLNEIIRNSGNRNISYYNADFSSLQEVRKVATDILSDYPALHLLINNAGMGGNKSNEREVSADGYELRFAVNYLAPFLLTHLLLPALRKGSPSKIVNVGSGAQEEIDFNNIMLENDYKGLRAYSQSKLGNLMFTLTLAELLEEQNITVNCVHPASLMNTNMVMSYFGYSKSTVEEGADSVQFVACSEETEKITGAFFNRKTLDKGHPQAYDQKARERLYILSKQLTGLGT